MIKKIFTYILLILAAFLVFSPILYAVSISFMTPQELFRGDFFPSSLNLGAYKEALTSIPLIHYLLVSFWMSFSVMLGQLVISSLTAYGLVFVPFKGRNIVFILILSTMLIPWESTIIPNFMTILHLDWINTFQGLSLPFFAVPFGIFFMRQNFMTLPKEIWESAVMDGCSRFRFFLSFALPLSKTALSAVGIHAFLTTWNKYLWPLLVTNDESVRPVQIGLKTMIQSEGSTDWNVVMASAVLVLLPTLLLLFVGLKYIREGLTAGAVKG